MTRKQITSFHFPRRVQALVGQICFLSQQGRAHQGAAACQYPLHLTSDTHMRQTRAESLTIFPQSDQLDLINPSAKLAHLVSAVVELQDPGAEVVVQVQLAKLAMAQIIFYQVVIVKNLIIIPRLVQVVQTTLITVLKPSASSKMILAYWMLVVLLCIFEITRKRLKDFELEVYFHQQVLIISVLQTLIKKMGD